MAMAIHSMAMSFWSDESFFRVVVVFVMREGFDWRGLEFFLGMGLL